MPEDGKQSEAIDQRTYRRGCWSALQELASMTQPCDDAGSTSSLSSPADIDYSLHTGSSSNPGCHCWPKQSTCFAAPRHASEVLSGSSEDAHRPSTGACRGRKPAHVIRDGSTIQCRVSVRRCKIFTEVISCPEHARATGQVLIVNAELEALAVLDLVKSARLQRHVGGQSAERSRSCRPYHSSIAMRKLALLQELPFSAW